LPYQLLLIILDPVNLAALAFHYSPSALILMLCLITLCLKLMKFQLLRSIYKQTS